MENIILTVQDVLKKLKISDLIKNNTVFLEELKKIISCENGGTIGMVDNLLLKIVQADENEMGRSYYMTLSATKEGNILITAQTNTMTSIETYDVSKDGIVIKNIRTTYEDNNEYNVESGTYVQNTSFLTNGTLLVKEYKENDTSKTKHLKH